MEDVLVERRFDEPVDYDGFRGANDQAPGCYDIYRLTYCGTFVSLDGRRWLCHMKAPDAQSVRTPSEVYRVPFSAIWTARRLAGAAPLDPPGPRGLVAYLCPDVLADPSLEPRPRAVLLERRADLPIPPATFAREVADALGDERLLVTYGSLDRRRAIAVLSGVSAEAVAAAFPGCQSWEAAMCTRKHR